MLKPSKTFKMSKQNKRFLATIVDPVMRGHIKRMAIQSQLFSEIVPKREKKTRGNGANAQNDSTLD